MATKFHNDLNALKEKHDKDNNHTKEQCLSAKTQNKKILSQIITLHERIKILEDLGQVVKHKVNFKHLYDGLNQ